MAKAKAGKKKPKAKKPAKKTTNARAKSVPRKPTAQLSTPDAEPVKVPVSLYLNVARSIRQLCEEWPALRGVTVNHESRTVVAPIYPAKHQNGERAEFEGRDKPWQLFRALWQAKEYGVDRQTLLELLWPDKAVSVNNLDQQKRVCNKLLMPLRLEICADNRGVWRLTSF